MHMVIENEFESTDCDLTIRQANTRFVKQNSECQQAINKLREIEKFLDEFGFLMFGRDFVFVASEENTIFFSLSSVMISLELTMGSIIACCESACIADANTLLRKYRDDLFFYLYISVYESLDKCSEKAKTMATKIIRWLNNDLANFHIDQVLKAIASAPQLSDAVMKYNLKESFQKIGAALNSYVHSNGYAYYNRNANTYKGNELSAELKKLEENVRYMTIVFLLLLVFCSPLSIMTTDYIDFLEVNETPSENSQYWVAPFVDQFIKENISLIDMNCLDYLRENTLMQL